MTQRRLLIVGCGDVALRVARRLHGRYRLYGVIRDPAKRALLAAHGITPVLADLDRPASLDRLAGVGELVLHSAPPPLEGSVDPRTQSLLRALSKGASLPYRLVYISTSGVYGDCHGEWVAETKPVNPESDRAARRVDAEHQLRAFGQRTGAVVTLLRAPGIYAAERLPIERLRRATPVLTAEDDGYTNHIHADDLAAIVVAALTRGRAGRCYNAADESWLKMGDYFDLVADRFGIPRPRRISWQQAQRDIPSALLSFMAESRRLLSSRMRAELRVRLRYPRVTDFLETMGRG